MQQGNLPIKIQEVFKLTNLQLNPDLFKFGNLTFESEKYICVKDNQEVVIIDTSKNFAADRKPMKADAILMHKQKNVIALRAQTGDNNVIQVFDLDTKQKLKQCDVPEQVTYWRWISVNKLGIVGKNSVYHVDITNTEPAVKMFDRAAQLANCQIMSYGVDSTEKWCYLVGLYSTEQKQIQGQMQLFFTEKRQQQLLEGYTGCFTDIPITDNSAYKNSLFCFCEKKAAEQVQRLHFMEIGNPAPNQQKFKKSIDIMIPPDAAGDFPVLMQAVDKYGVIFIITKMGYLYIYEVSNAVAIFRQRITDSLMFVAAKNPNTDGMISINKAGQIISLNIDEANFIPFIINQCKHIPDNVGLAFKLAQRFSLKGADELFVTQFNKLVMSGDFQGAARVARDAPGTLLRNQETINKFKTLQSQGGPQPILVYFSTLLETTKLNEIESIELARPVLQQGKINLIEDWMKQGKLTMTDQFGDLIRQYNPQLALTVYVQSDSSPDKVIQGLIETNQYDKIMPYIQKSNCSPDFVKILKNLVPVNPEAAVGLAKMITNKEGGNVPKVSIDSVVQVFLENGRIQETTAFLLEALKQNRPDEGHLQTKLFEINLMSAPNVAEGIFQLNIFTHFDRERVAKLCEQAGLYGRALQNYTSMQDAKRVMLNTHAIPKEQLIEYFGKLSEDDALVCMYDILKSNRQNIGIVAEIAVKYSGKIPTKKSIEVLESLGTSEGLLFFLAHVLPTTDDPDIYFKYIEACTRLGNYKEVERVIRETTFYDPVKVKDFLKEQKLPDPRPLIYLCDQHNFTEELTKYLYKNKQNKFIEIYLFKVNTAATPKVLGTLLDMDCDELYIKQLLNSIRVCPIPELVEEFEKRGKIRHLQGWLEARYEERIQEPALHNALAIIYIDINKDPQDFLIKNPYYDSKIVGKYCEERNPDLAFIAYKRAWGSCDNELVEVTNKNYLYRMQARYLVERQSPELWAHVLIEDNPHRKQVIDQVVQTALPETKNADEVSTTVKAFMDADMPNELIELLERIVLHNSDFASNKNLQNLLILTAIKADKTRVMDYINRLDNYDGQELAKIAKKEQYQLFDEALCIYKKFGEHVEAVKVLIENLKNLPAATEYAEKINKAEVWSEIGKAQLDNFNVKEAIDAFIKAKDPSMYALVIGTAGNQDCWEDLVQYLLMARAVLKEQMIDSELIFAYAKCGTRYLPELETFITEPNQADFQKCGDKCYDEKLYEAARILYNHIGNNQKLAQTLVKLKQYQAAFEAAKKADVPKVWKEVCFACVRAKEFRTANLCGQKIIILPDHLEDVIKHYERFGYYEEVIQLLEQGMSLERTHTGIFTHLGVLYAKFQPQRLMDHIRTYCQKLQIPMLIEACKKYQMWPEVVFLNAQYGQFDQAIVTMIEHSPTAWKHDLFSQNIVKVSNYDLYYRSMIFYLEEEPMLLNDILKLLSMKIDLTKCVQVMKRTGHIALITPFLKSVQNQNISAVNEAINQIYLENEDYESLRASIKEYDSFESLKLASDLERHELLECRRIAALLYRKNKKFQQSIEISQKDELYKDAMETVAESKDTVLAENLIRFIMNMEDKELFAAMLYTCYELVKPDVALEIAWRCGLYEYVMPYFIQFVKDLSLKVDTVQKKHDDIKKKVDQTAEDQMSQPLDIDVNFLFPGMMGGMNQMQALMPPPGSMPNLNMGGMNYGGMGGGFGGQY